MDALFTYKMALRGTVLQDRESKKRNEQWLQKDSSPSITSGLKPCMLVVGYLKNMVLKE